VPDLCLPTAAQSADLTQATIVITDANGVDHVLPVFPSGNFHSDHQGSNPIVFPIQAKVVYMGKERQMLMMQTTGDCNSCHTNHGANNAPGRITLPE
jgi:hypothetical protein